MINELDDYLRRYLKNWAARHSPPKDGRERLLRAAAFNSFPPEQSTRRSRFSGVFQLISQRSFEYSARKDYLVPVLFGNYSTWLGESTWQVTPG